MKRFTLPLALALTGAFASAAPSEVGTKLPELDALKWYNTPALTLEALNGKAVLVEVFRTW